MKLILIAGALALFLSLFGTPALIKVLARRGYGQMIRDDGPSTHHTKRGTPTMGGIIIIFAALVGYLLSHLLTQSSVTVSAVLILGLVISLGLVGFLDDYMKVSRQNSRGISGKQKIFGQVLFASIFGYLGTRFPDGDGLTPISQNLSTLRDTSITLGVFLVVIWIALMVTATSNGVNLTDGLDGLATGASVMTFLAFVLIGVWEFGQSCAISASSNCYNVRDPLDLAVLAAAFAGACTGFLWWNACRISARAVTSYPSRRTLRHHHTLCCNADHLLQNHRWKTPL
jgi:phospho-N-acetylmuramoyl-pentapeptide-transferase